MSDTSCATNTCATENAGAVAFAPNLEMQNPIMPYLRQERIPHIWCPGCGIGTTVNCFIRGLEESGLDLDNVAVVSGIGCTGRVAGYLNLDSFHTTHGRPIPFATGLKLANPKLKTRSCGSCGKNASRTSGAPAAASAPR